MLPKSSRLTRQEFYLAKKTSTFTSSPIGKLNISPFFSGQNSGKFSVVTSKKLHKSAVVRNRIRRVIYNSLQGHTYKSNVIIYPSISLLSKSPSEIGMLVNQVLSGTPHL